MVSPSSVVAKALALARVRVDAVVALGLGALFFILRASRYDLILGFYGSFTLLPTKLMADPQLFAGHYVRAVAEGAMPFAHWLLGHLARLGLDPLGLEYARLLALNLLAAAGVWMLARAIIQDRLTAVVAVMLLVGGGLGVLGLGYGWTVGDFADWGLFGQAMGWLALALALRGAHVSASALVGLALWVSPGQALIAGALVVTVRFVRDGAPGWREAVALVVVAAPAIVYLGPKLGALLGTGVEPATWWTFARARKPWLFLLARSSGTFAAATGFVAVGLLARAAFLRTRRNDVRTERVITAVLTGSAVLCAVGFVFTELIPLVPVAKAGLFRASNYAEAILAMYLVALVRDGAAAGRTWWVTALLVASAMTWLDLSRWATLPVILAAAGVAYIVAWPTPRVGGETALRAAVMILAVLICAHVYVQALPRLTGGDYRGPALAASWRDVQFWARAHTPDGTTFLNPPDWCGFEVYSDRPAVTNICDMGRSLWMTGTLAEELQRIRAYAAPGTEATVIASRHALDALETRYEALDAEELRRLGRAVGAAYTIMPKPGRAALTPAYENDLFVVYSLHE